MAQPCASLRDVKESKDYNFPDEEEEVLKFWQEIDAFKEQLRRTEGKPEYSFYDGPPFATGLPHYGHLLAGTLKAGAAAACTTCRGGRRCPPAYHAVAPQAGRQALCSTRLHRLHC